MASKKHGIKKLLGKEIPKGRVKGVPNNKSQYVRDHEFKCRCTRGALEVIKEMVNQKMFKSQADAFHEAVQVLAARKLPATFHWYDKIQ